MTFLFAVAYQVEKPLKKEKETNFLFVVV